MNTAIDERAAIVAWLKKEAAKGAGVMPMAILWEAIERGDHLPVLLYADWDLDFEHFADGEDE